MQQILILCPVYNDEVCFNLFTVQLVNQVKHLTTYHFSFLIVNDGSSKKPALKSALPTNIIHLHRNLGHQKAIAIGLSYAQQNLPFEKVIIMDVDGEDRPED